MLTSSPYEDSVDLEAPPNDHNSNYLLTTTTDRSVPHQTLHSLTQTAPSNHDRDFVQTGSIQLDDQAIPHNRRQALNAMTQ